jgi:lipopolysaccharide biosynthesis glycosyltransferase
MKTFKEDFFNVENFVLYKKRYDFLPAHTKGSIWNICYNVNNTYIPAMGVSAISIIKNNPNHNFIIHIFTDGYTPDNEVKVQEMARLYHCCCILYTLDMQPFSEFHIKVKRFSHITYVRLYIPKILRGIASRYLYIDADAICINSLECLFQYDLQGKAIGAVSESPNDVEYRSKFLHLKSHKYFNDGILLVDVNEWEKEHITEKCFSYQCEPPERFLGQSQDIINLVFDGTNCFLPSAYNFDSNNKDINSTICIVHWRGRRKPWQMVLHQFDEQWRLYNEESPWDTITNVLPVKNPDNYHDFKFWGQYQKDQGNWSGYFIGLFWYSWLRIRYKLHI